MIVTGSTELGFILLGFILYFILHCLAVHFVLRNGHLNDSMRFTLKFSYVVALGVIIFIMLFIGMKQFEIDYNTAVKLATVLTMSLLSLGFLIYKIAQKAQQSKRNEYIQ